MSDNTTFKRDPNIGKKYIVKDNLSFATDYYSIAVMVWWMPWIFFFVNPSIIMWVIGVIYLSVFAYLYKQKNKAIITSVSVYKYNIVFMDVLMKSFKLNKGWIKEIKKLFKNKK